MLLSVFCDFSIDATGGFMGNNEITFIMNNYVVAYIDMLGQRSMLEEVSAYPLRGGQSNITIHKFEKYIEQCKLSIDILRRIFDEKLNDQNKIHINLENIPVDKSLLFAFTQQSFVKKNEFSDSIILYLSISDVFSTMNGIYCILTCCSSIYPLFIAINNPLRGGIALHWGTEMESGGIYGPAYYQAYKLENENAKYPRIIIDKELAYYLQKMSDINPENSMDILAVMTARLCLSMLSTDNDGYDIIDYLGIGYRDVITPNDRTKLVKEFLIDAYRYIVDEYQRLYREESVLLEKYEYLLKYFNTRLPLWECDGFNIPLVEPYK